MGLADVAGRRVGGYSLGMRQRLGLAFALLGDPGVLVLDEPTNGLDPEGIIWMRGLLRELARQGRTVLVSSHLLTEVQQTADRLLIISHGSLVFEGSVEDLAEPAEQAVVVDSPDRQGLADALTAAGIAYENLRTGFSVRGADPTDIGAIALAAGVVLSGLQKRGPSLEEVFLELVNGSRVHTTAVASPPSSPAVAAPAAEAITAEDSTEETGGEEPVAEVPPAIEVPPATEKPPAVTDDDAEDAQPTYAPVSSFAVAATGIIEVVPRGEDIRDESIGDEALEHRREDDDSEERS